MEVARFSILFDAEADERKKSQSGLFKDNKDKKLTDQSLIFYHFLPKVQ
jgi:hypothetical protein